MNGFPIKCLLLLFIMAIYGVSDDDKVASRVTLLSRSYSEANLLNLRAE